MELEVSLEGEHVLELEAHRYNGMPGKAEMFKLGLSKRWRLLRVRDSWGKLLFLQLEGELEGLLECRERRKINEEKKCLFCDS